MKMKKELYSLLAVFFCWNGAVVTADVEPIRIFIFAGQSNMVGSDSHVRDIDRFPPFAGFGETQADVMFSYCIGREDKMKSNGWVDLQPVNDVVGPELSFARRLGRELEAPIGIIKCAAGGTHLGGDWNPDEPQGFKMYPLALELVKSSLAKLDQKKIPYRLEGFVWHQGENDMFEEEYMAKYGDNLKDFLDTWRRDLQTPNLKFYIGELCTKTIWGMDLRPRMYAISQGQRAVTNADPLAEYVPTSHVGVEIGGGVGLHYHYGTLGQLEQGVNYADAYLRTIGKQDGKERVLERWPYQTDSSVKLFVLAGFRNMEGERAFVQQLKTRNRDLLDDHPGIAFRYSIGGGYKKSGGWEPLGPAGFYDTFGPELSFGRLLKKELPGNVAIAKFTHSGSQMNDWTPDGSLAKSRHLYPQFIEFVRESIRKLEQRGHRVELAGIFLHIGENEMSMPPYRQRVPEWLTATVKQSRQDLALPAVKWFVSQQPPTDHESVNSIDVTAALEEVASADENLFLIKAFDLPPQSKQLVLDTFGIVSLGQLMAESYLQQN
ncbi:MAG: sialate O-acetylesterase [Planctomycetaceae bacterium]|nr:sialate O-acetylesterase [Planctomycetaceae bacterium]